MGWIGIKAKVWGEILSSNGLLRGWIWMTKATIIGRGDTIDYSGIWCLKSMLSIVNLDGCIGRRKEQSGEISENKG